MIASICLQDATLRLMGNVPALLLQSALAAAEFALSAVVRVPLEDSGSFLGISGRSS